MFNKINLTIDSVLGEMLKCAVPMKATEQHFLVQLSVSILFKVLITFESMDENATEALSSLVFTSGTVCHS